MTRQIFENKIASIVKRNIKNPDLNGAFIAKIMNTNRMYIHRKLKLYFNQSATEFILEIRIEKAKKLLCESDLLITDIALEVGYNEISYFSKVFKNYTNLSPSEYRKSCL